jgi:hypothetical protein
VTIGFGKLSSLARLSQNNCRLNARNLIRKLAIEEVKSENSAAGIGKIDWDPAFSQRADAIEINRASNLARGVQTNSTALLRHAVQTRKLPSPTG